MTDDDFFSTKITGDGESSSFNIEHNLNSKVIVDVMDPKFTPVANVGIGQGEPNSSTLSFECPIPKGVELNVFMVRLK